MKIFKRNKWELIEENKRMISYQYNPIIGWEGKKTPVTVDVYRKLKRNGIYKYKHVVRGEIR
jgi:hypothetical protein